MLARALARDTAQTAITAALTGLGATVETDKDTPAQSGKMPIVAIYAMDKKHQTGAGTIEFETRITVTIEVRCEGDTKAAAQGQCDSICEAIEGALLNGASAFFKLFEQIEDVDTYPEYEGSQNKKHIFSGTIEIVGRVLESFEPARGNALEKVFVTVAPGGDGTPTYDIEIDVPQE